MSVTEPLKQLTEDENVNIQTEKRVQQQARVNEAYQPECGTIEIFVGYLPTPLDVYIKDGAAEIRDVIGKQEAESDGDSDE
jgi:hypothetical protein